VERDKIHLAYLLEEATDCIGARKACTAATQTRAKITTLENILERKSIQ